MVDGPVIQDESAEALALGQVPNDVGAALAGIAVGDRRQGLEYRRDPLARLLHLGHRQREEAELAGQAAASLPSWRAGTLPQDKCGWSTKSFAVQGRPLG